MASTSVDLLVAYSNPSTQVTEVRKRLNSLATSPGEGGEADPGPQQSP